MTVTSQNRCNVCEKTFTRKGDLTRHENIHAGKRPHKCPYCDKNFGQASGLKTHINTHTKAKPYKCGVNGCRKIFSDPSSCTRHRKETHNPDESHQCPMCNSSIKRRSTFVNHMSTKHGVTGINPEEYVQQSSRRPRRARAHPESPALERTLCFDTLIDINDAPYSFDNPTDINDVSQPFNVTSTTARYNDNSLYNASILQLPQANYYSSTNYYPSTSRSPSQSPALSPPSSSSTTSTCSSPSPVPEPEWITDPTHVANLQPAYPGTADMGLGQMKDFVQTQNDNGYTHFYPVNPVDSVSAYMGGAYELSRQDPCIWGIHPSYSYHSGDAVAH